MPGGRNAKNALQFIIKAGNKALTSAFAPKKKINRQRRSRLTQPQPKLITYKGNVYVRKLKRQPGLPKLKPTIIPKLPIAGPTVTPLPLQNTVVLTGVASEGAGASNLIQQTISSLSFREKLIAWLKHNGPVLILNFGSICTLVGFTRQDILELRCLSMTGSLSFVAYQIFQTPLKWAPIAWSCLFAAVNGKKIINILNERNSSVVLTEQDEEVFVEHFMPHGVTPKQFEKLMKKATLRYYDKEDMIVRQGEELNTVFLVVRGDTTGSILGRRYTAVSSHPGYSSKRGGDSGAWIGEMAFLQYFGEKEAKRMKRKITKSIRNGADLHELHTQNIGRALFTIIAEENSTVLLWSFQDLESLMNTSTDLRGAMTRAMTAPIVGKVINFTVSKSAGKPGWIAWLDDWKSSGARISTFQNESNTLQTETEDEEEDEEDEFDHDEDEDEDMSEIDIIKQIIPSRR